MESPEVEASLKRGKVYGFLEDLMELCSKHSVSIETASGETAVEFHGWESFNGLEVEAEDASLFWPRIQTDIIVRRRKDEQRKS